MSARVFVCVWCVWHGRRCMMWEERRGTIFSGPRPDDCVYITALGGGVTVKCHFCGAFFPA